MNPVIDNDKYDDKTYPKKSDGSDYIFMLDYSKFTPYMWSAMQELITRIEILESKLNSFTNK